MINFCISGGSSGAGKTSLICGLLPCFPGFGVVKFSVGEDYWGQEPLIIKDGSLLQQPGKDSQRYLQAGAEKVVFVRCRKEQLGLAVGTVQAELADSPGLFWEGNRITDYITPRFLVLVVGEAGLKPSAKALIPRADLLVYNQHFSSKPGPVLDLIRRVNRYAPFVKLDLSAFSSVKANEIAGLINRCQEEKNSKAGGSEKIEH